MLKPILEKFKGLTIFEERCVEENQLELVILNQQLEYWVTILTSVLGVPLKQAGVQPEQSHLELTEDFGGIALNQTLFYREFRDAKVIAMFWPWSNATQITLNIKLFPQ